MITITIIIIKWKLVRNAEAQDSVESESAFELHSLVIHIYIRG